MSATRVAERRGKHLDFYETPTRVTDGLLDKGFMSDGCRVLDPCAGKGMIIRQVLERYPRCSFAAYDIQDFTESFSSLTVCDFLSLKPDPCFDRIVANPPFSQAEEFIKHAHKFLAPGGRMAFLLRLPFIASVKRYELLRVFRPLSVYVLAQRPKFGGTNIDSCDYAWIVWTNEVTISTLLDWIAPMGN